MVSAPERAARAATTDESTPPDIATTMRLPFRLPSWKRSSMSSAIAVRIKFVMVYGLFTKSRA